MQVCTVRIQTPSRLHFGLFSFGNHGRQFGGVGVMIERPSLVLELSAADRFEVSGACCEELNACAHQWAQYFQLKQLPACRLDLQASLPRHVGLGSGTQLAAAVAAGLTAFSRRPPLTAIELAQATGRGKRSAIGTYGFLLGGLLVESGKLADEELSPLEDRWEFPAAWRFVLVQADTSAGLHGCRERQAFDRLPPVDPRVREELIAEVRSVMLPALKASDCDAFSHSLYRFGYRAGLCFAPAQGGPYNGPRIAALVREIRELGVPGVAQSSWGPTLCCVVPDQASGDALQTELDRRYTGENLLTLVTEANNCGARITVT